MANKKINKSKKNNKKSNKKSNKKIIAIILFVLITALIFLTVKIIASFTENTQELYVENIPAKTELNKVEAGIRNFEEFSDFKVRGSNNLIYIIINIEEDIETSLIETNLNSFLTNLDDSIKSNYDIQVLIDGEAGNMPIVGQKHITSFGFVYTYGGGEHEE